MTPQFKRAVEVYGPRFMADLGLKSHHVAGIFGNFAVESDQFRALQEYKPVVAGSRGGWGWAQWTGPRRRQFEAWADANGLKRDDSEAFYGFAVHELRTTEKAALTALKRATTVEAAAEAFMRGYERPGVPHVQKRKLFAREAHALLAGEDVPSAPRKPRTDRMSIPAGKWAEEALADFEIRSIQSRLRQLGYYTVGKVDGKWGPSTRGALVALQATAGITQDGHWGPQTKAALADDKNRRKVDAHRASTTSSDLRAQGSAIVIESDRITWSGILGLLAALAGAAYTAWQTPSDLPMGSSILLTFLPPSVAAVVSAIGPFLLAFIPLAYNVLKSRQIIEARVQAERSGLHNGEPDPAPSPPVTAPPDGPRPGGLFGSIFRAS